MVDLTKYYSHPGKQLLAHVDGVVERVRSLTNLRIAEVASIFHDVGKLNPNFQIKVNSQPASGYSNHSYISALGFLCYCVSKKPLPKDEEKWITSILAIVAHHHGDLPDFSNILHEDECSNLSSFINKNQNLPIAEFIKEYKKYIPDTKDFVVTDKEVEIFCEFQRRYNKYKHNFIASDCIDFFLKTRFAFASVIVADKSDASNYQGIESVHQFNEQYNVKVDNYVKNLKGSNINLDNIRTKMRKEAISNITIELEKGSRVFSLTAPTGSGKTIMLLSLAGKILNVKKNLRIIYALPFLSITEQVESVCRDIFNGLDNCIYRIDSKSDNKDFEQTQLKLDSGNMEAVKELIVSQQFAEDIFDYPFIITTFVRFFEALVSNKNATLLKLPNFANAIFLIDEIQSIPPRLYGFFIALLDSFCKEFNSYAIISTATMPDFELPQNNSHNLYKIFHNYTKPVELLSLEYFNNPMFNRYNIKRLSEPIIIDELANMIEKEHAPVLIILNTIQDTKDLCSELNKKNINSEIILINTHFTPHDRKEKIKHSKELLKNGEKVILVSTQLIEAGVDIDFPIVYRDFCPIPNIVQSAGRCNRNNKQNNGKVIVFDLQKDNKSRSNLIYQGKDSRFLNFAKEKIKNDKLQECELIDIQKSFFKDVQEKALFGVHYSNRYEDNEIDFIARIKENAFAEIGKFRLIDDKDFGEERRYYVPKDSQDSEFEQLQRLSVELKQIDFKDFESRRLKNIEISNQFKKMADNVVQVRLKTNDSQPLVEAECFGLSKLSYECYNKDTGIRLTSENQIL